MNSRIRVLQGKITINPSEYITIVDCISDLKAQQLSILSKLNNVLADKEKIEKDFLNIVGPDIPIRTYLVEDEIITIIYEKGIFVTKAEK